MITTKVSLQEAAKDFLLAYFSDGEERQPDNFDREILGIEDPSQEVIKILVEGIPTWNKTIFCDALGDLVTDGKIDAWHDEKGWHYKINKL